MEANKPIRNMPHVEGNFATHIAFKIFSNLKSVEEVKRLIKSSNLNEKLFDILEDSCSYHISLSKTVYLKFHQINSFLSTLKRDLDGFKTQTLIITPQVSVFNNEENTRHFIALEVMKNKGLNKLIKTINDVLFGFGFTDCLYGGNNFSPHISILWANKNIRETLSEEKMNKQIKKDNKLTNSIEKGYLKIFKFTELYVTIGSRVDVIKFSQ